MLQRSKFEKRLDIYESNCIVLMDYMDYYLMFLIQAQLLKNRGVYYAT